MNACSKEKWADIAGFEGYYQISNRGNVRSCERLLPAANGGTQKKRGQIIKPTTMPNGYLQVGLHKDGVHRCAYVHRLVAIAFLDNPKGFTEVNHKDENKANNQVDNLEWCSHYYNINYGTTRSRISKTHIERGCSAIPVAQVLNGRVVAVFKSATDAERATGISSSSIRKCCLKRPRFKTAGGYSWENY